MSEWRDEAARILLETEQALPFDASFAQVRKAFRQAYPFGQRAMHPYKIWCDEQEKFLRRRFPLVFEPEDKKKLIMASRATGQQLFISEEEYEEREL